MQLQQWYMKMASVLKKWNWTLMF